MCSVKNKKHGVGYMCRHYVPRSLLENSSNCEGLSTVSPPLVTSAAGVELEHNAKLQFADTGIATTIASCVNEGERTETETQFSEVEQFDLTNCIMEGGYQEENEEVAFNQEALTSPKET